MSARARCSRSPGLSVMPSPSSYRHAAGPAIIPPGRFPARTNSLPTPVPSNPWLIPFPSDWRIGEHAMHDVCTEQHVGNAKCASLPFLSRCFSLSFSLILLSFPRLFLALVHCVEVGATLGLLRHGRAGRNINDQANHPERTSGGGQPSRWRDACNCCEPAKCRIGGLNSSWQWRGWMRAQDSTHSAREAEGTGGGGRGTTSEYGLTVFVDGPSARYSP